MGIPFDKVAGNPYILKEMHTDPFIPTFVATIFAILVIGVILRRFRQSHVIAYLLAGFFLGPHTLGVIQEPDTLNALGSLGVLFLLFFLGMEISPRKLAKNWVVPVFGTFLQIATSVFVIAILGFYQNWSIARIIFLGFVISLSSTAVVLKLLEDWNETHTRVGQNVVGILLVQDILIVPMLICISFLGETEPPLRDILLQGIGGIFIISLVSWIIMKEEIEIPFLKVVKNDHELQLFSSLGICFGMALLLGTLGLSSALGAFVGGLIVGSAKETHWVHQKLLSLRTLFIAFFFVSIGMLIDLDFIIENLGLVLLLLAAVFITNTVINGLILKFLREDWKVSLHGGSLLSQIGEFSFIIASVGYRSGVIQYATYEFTISIVALSLMFSPPWILFIHWITEKADKKLQRNQ